MEILIAIYLVSFFMVNAFTFFEAFVKNYSNFDFFISVLISLVPVFNTIMAVVGLFYFVPKIKWMSKPFFIQPKR